ncbi:MAG: hypothetical protein H6650_11030 [Ardenticatenales bacterium]|nr:hypothetical protein [Ardenticatenales bacterium]
MISLLLAAFSEQAYNAAVFTPSSSLNMEDKMKVSARVFTLLGLMALALFVAMPHQQAVANDAQIDRIVRSGNTIVNLDTMEVTFLGADAVAPAAPAAEVLQNPGFETGVLAPWYTTNNQWSVINSGCQSGSYCATDIGNYWIQQDFAGIPGTQITSIAFWSRQPEAAIQAVDLLYSDGTYYENIVFPTADWQRFDVTSWLDPNKTLTGIRLWGYSGGGGDPDVTVIDNVSVIGGCSPVSTSVTLSPNLSLSVSTGDTNKYWLVRLYFANGTSQTAVQTGLPACFSNTFNTNYVPTNPPVTSICSFVYDPAVPGVVAQNCAPVP